MKIAKQATRFFFHNAGYSYDPKVESKQAGRWRCARELARAEQYAKDQEWFCIWESDWSLGCSHQEFFGDGSAYADREPETCETCTLYRHAEPTDEILASLGCIDDATPEYRRVIEAELALEAITERENRLDREANSAADVPVTL